MPREMETGGELEQENETFFTPERAPERVGHCLWAHPGAYGRRMVCVLPENACG